MTSSFVPDPLTDLRLLLSQGRYQEVLDRHANQSADWPVKDPSLALAVATAATRLGRLAEGEMLAGSALADFRRRADDDGRMRTLNLLGAIAFERGRLRDAADHWIAARDLARSHRDPLMEARASNNLASVRYLEGAVQEAQSLYREALLAYQRLADRRGMAETCHNLAITYRDADDLEAADDSDTEALRHAEAVGDPSLLALMITGRAETLVRQRQFALAHEGLDRAEALTRAANDPVGLAEVNRVRAERCLALDQPEQAIAYAESGAGEAERHASAQLEAECAELAAEAYRRLGRRSEAEQRQARANEIYRMLGKSDGGRETG